MRSLVALSVALALGPTALAADSALLIDPERIAPRPLLKSKLGFARAVGFDRLPDSIPWLSDIGARAFCAEIPFDDAAISDRRNYAVDAKAFADTRSQKALQPNPWFNAVLDRLSAGAIEPYFSLIGAPPPYIAPTIRRPAAHPTPTDIQRAAASIADWSQVYLRTHPDINWIIWNEPEHTLRGDNTVQAAEDMAAIYKAYYRAIDPISPYDGIGLASFMKASLKPTTGEAGRNFFQSVLDRTLTGQADAPRVDYIPMNNYHGKTDEFLGMMQNELGRRHLDLPLLFAQYAPWQIMEQAGIGRGNEAAGLYLETLDALQSEPSVRHACMSYWSGIDTKAFLRWDERSQKFEPSRAYRALAMYQRMPLWRVALPSELGSGVQAYASADRQRVSVLLTNLPRARDIEAPPATARDRVDRERLRKADRIAERTQARAEAREERQQARRGGPTSGSVDAGGTSGGQPVTLTVRGYAGQEFTLERLTQADERIVSQRLRADANGTLTLQLGSGDIALLQGQRSTPSKARPLPVMRSDVYIHRVDQDKRQIPERELAAADFDPIQDGFVLEAPSSRTVAHASAWLQGAPRQLNLALSTPPGQNPASAGACSAVVLQYMDKGQAIGNKSIGATNTLSTMRQSRHLAGQPQGPSVTSANWQAGPDGTLLLPLDLDQGAPAGWSGGPRELRVHAGLGHCPQAQTMAQIRLQP